MSNDTPYNVVTDVLEQHIDALQKMNAKNEEWGIMDHIRFEQIEELKTAIKMYKERDQRLVFLVREFFKMLDTVEESDSGREFHPVTISCCRTMMIDPLNDILKEMKKLTHE